ncbi:hypothetical protein V9K97_11300 [Variovorax sp. CCNWLW186]|uniref:hypothetical protein n=1 Tax=Variovorax sp. CCNWLW186 TaxID=3127473 RepID=UPI0030785D77
MSSGGKNGSGFESGDNDGALHDPVLRRALDHAPDSGAMPDPRTRDAIRKMAHNLAPVSKLEPISDGEGVAPWWRRLFGAGEAHSRMPWNAAFATVLVATCVTVLWYREPIPDARLDGEAQVGGAAAPAPVQPSAPSPAVVAPVPQAPAIREAAPVQPAPKATEPARDSANEGSVRSRADALRRPAPAPSGKQAATTPEMDRKTLEVPPPVAAAPPAPAPAAAPALPPSVAEQSAAEPRAFPRTEDRRPTEPESDRASGAIGGAPAIASAPPAAPMVLAGPPSVQRESADSSAPALSAQRNANAESSPAMRQAPAPRAAAAAKGASPQGDMSQFSALDGWTSFNYVRAGQAVRHARGDVEGLAASVNSVARSATVPGGDLAAPVEARLELYRGTALLAVLEIAGDQVRWRPQAGGRPSIGTPQASALAALRALLTRK